MRPFIAASLSLMLFPNVFAYRLIQNTSVGPTSNGAPVACDAPGGFTHRTIHSIPWFINPANEGSQAGVVTAIQGAMSSWNAVIPGGVYSLSYGGSTNSSAAVDGQNTVVFGTNGACTGSCLALTTLVLASGQVISEADVTFNTSATWSTNGSDTDVQAIAAHELGHTLGIHHTEQRPKPIRTCPTMYTAYFGTDGRSLETDDKNALICSYNRYH